MALHQYNTTKLLLLIYFYISVQGLMMVHLGRNLQRTENKILFLQ
jgi:hypothetical protein